jgi:hypothetical protein
LGFFGGAFWGGLCATAAIPASSRSMSFLVIDFVAPLDDPWCRHGANHELAKSQEN